MAHIVKVASVLFQTEAEKGAADAGEVVLAELEQAMADLHGLGLDLVVFSEGVESIGQTVDDAEPLDAPGPFLRCYQAFAASAGCHVAGSLKLLDDGHVYNALVYVDPRSQVLGAYRKVNLTVSEIEEGMTSGPGPVVIDTAIGRLAGAICFDLNFREIREAYARLKPDIITFASMYHGGLMQAFWAYQCQAYFVAALPFIGGGILDPFGRPIAYTDCYTSVARATINLDRAMVHLDYNREKFAAIERKYLDRIVIDTPPNVGPALIVSRSQRLSAMDVVEEFDLELLDDYFARSLAANTANRV